MIGYARSSVLIALLAIILPAPTFSEDLVGRASVIDGDTIEIRGTRIRLHGIDAPESAQICEDKSGHSWPCGQMATAALARQIGSRPIVCESRGKDRYGRVIAICNLADLDLNLWLVTQGWAVAYRRYSMDYVEAESQASRHGVGIWSGTFIMPWDYRAARWKDASNNAPDPNCPIKGNINRDGERIYHTPWDSHSYDKTKINTAKGERWFCDEAEAMAAGWRPAIH